MAFGDCLKRELVEGTFLKCEDKKTSNNAFWVLLRDTAVKDLRAYAPKKIDSGIAISIYYEILSNNTQYLPSFICTTLNSNNN